MQFESVLALEKPVVVFQLGEGEDGLKASAALQHLALRIRIPPTQSGNFDGNLDEPSDLRGLYFQTFSDKSM